MSQTLQIPSVPQRPSTITTENNITSDLVIEFQVMVDNVNQPLNSSYQRAIIRPARHVNAKSLEEFKTELHEIMPSLKDVTDEDLERLISERNSDNVDDE
jgi:hypothetical protein